MKVNLDGFRVIERDTVCVIDVPVRRGVNR